MARSPGNATRQQVELICHAAAPSAAVRRILVVLDCIGGELRLRYELEGATDAVLLPPPHVAKFADNLWRHTCFEAFVKEADSNAYCELNFSPSTEWAAYWFTDYRQSMTPIDIPTLPSISIERSAERLSIDAVVQLSALRELHYGGQLQLALSAVIEDNDRRISYWALVHPTEKPDFHHAASFALTLPALR